MSFPNTSPKLYVPGTGNSVVYAERPGSPEEYYQGGFKVRRTFDVPYLERWAFCYGLMGGPYLTQVDPEADVYAERSPFDVNTNIPATVSRVMPVGFRASKRNDYDLPAGPWMFPTAIEKVEPVGPITNVRTYNTYRGKVEQATYDVARVTVTYEALTYTLRSDSWMISNGHWMTQKDGHQIIPDESSMQRYVTRFRQPTAEYLTLPFGGLRWVSDNNFVRGSHGKVVAAQELMYVWHQVPGIPFAISSYLGCVNDRSFSDGKEDFPRGTLLLTSVDIKPYRWFFGQMVYDITYKMKNFIPVDQWPPKNTNGTALVDITPDRDNVPVAEPYGHNHFLRYKPGQSVSEQPNANPDPNGNAPRLVPLPKYELITDNAVRPALSAGERRGRTVYDYRDFRRLFDLNWVAPPDPLNGGTNKDDTQGTLPGDSEL